METNLFHNQGPAVNSEVIQGNVNASTTIYNNAPEPDPIPNGVNFRVAKPDTNFTGRTQELAQLKNVSLSTNAEIVLVLGMGGVGKTQLVRKFIVENRSRYGNVIWIDSENEAKVKDSFEDLSEKTLRLPATAGNGTDEDSKFVIERVVNRLCHRRTLFVYDNVYSFKDIKFILAVAPPITENLHILITSSTQYWPTGIDVIPLNVWSPMESIEFVTEMLKKKLKDSNDDDVTNKIKLVKTLQYLPLALRQATVFINEKRKRYKKYTISQYIDEYTRNSMELLKSTIFEDDSVSPYNKTTFTVWDSTINAIREDAVDGKLALRILRIAAHFEADNIDTELFFQLTRNYGNQSIEADHEKSCDDNDTEEREEFEERVRSAVELLTNHYMVDRVEAQELFRMHRLVQQVTKLKLKASKEEEMILKDALVLTERIMKVKGTISYRSHYISVFLSASNSHFFIAFLERVSVDLLKNLTNAGYSDRDKEFGNMILGPLSKILQENDRDLLQIHFNVAYAHMITRSYEKALKMYLDIYHRQKTHFGEADADTRQTQVRIAYSYKELQNFNAALEWYEGAVNTHRKSLGKNDIRTREIMFELASVYIYLRKHIEAFQVFEEIYESEKLIFGENQVATFANKSAIAMELSKLGRHSEALRLFEDIYEKRILKYGEDDWRTRSTKYEIAFEYGKLGRIWKGLRLLDNIYVWESIK